MAEITEISWTDHTLNLWWGCAKVHAGCDHCYAEAFAHRYGHEIWGPKAPRKASKSAFRDVLKFQRKAAADGVIRRVFVGSMMDIFEKPFPLIDAQGNALPETTGHLRTRFFEEVVPQCPNLLFLLLTKRPGNILKYIPEEWKARPPVNVMYGTSVVNQETADEMIPKLLEVPGRRFLSMEPLIGPVNLKKIRIRDMQLGIPRYGTWGYNPLRGWRLDWGQGYRSDSEIGPKIEWVIVGGESGPGARPMHPKWATSLRDECQEAGTLFHFKQWGEWVAVDWGGEGRDVGYHGFLDGEYHDLTCSAGKAKVVSLPSYTTTIRPHGMADGAIYDYPVDVALIVNVGKKLAGHMLNRRTWQDVPTI